MSDMNVRELQTEIESLRAEIRELKRGPAVRLRDSLGRVASSRRTHLLLIAAVLAVAAASYASQRSLPYTFVNGTTADANQVNANFSYLDGKDHGDLGGLGDDDHQQYVLVNGTRAITGNLTVQGNSNLGNASDDTTTINDLLKLEGRSPGPSCNSVAEGTVYYDSNGHALCVCVYYGLTYQWTPATLGSCS